MRSTQAQTLLTMEGARDSVAPKRAADMTYRTIAITSGKGGVGKTQIAANLAVSLRQRGMRVLLLDADLGMASLDLVMGVTPTLDLRAVIERGVPVEDVLINGPAGVQLLPACPGRYEMATLGTVGHQKLVDAVESIANRFDVVIVDTGAGIGSTSVTFAGWADDVLLVVTPDPSSLRDAYAMAKVLHQRSGLRRIDVVASQVASDAEGRDVFERLRGVVRRFLPVELLHLGNVRRDDAVRSAVAHGTPVVLASPDGIASRSLRDIAARLVREKGLVTPC